MIRPLPTSTLFPYTTLFRSYTRYDVAYYAINDRAAGRRVIELDLMTAAQHEQVPEDEEVTAADRLIVESDRESTRLNSSHSSISYAVFCLKKKINPPRPRMH